LCGKGIPRCCERPFYRTGKSPVPDLIAVTGKFDDLMTAILQQIPFSQIYRIFTPGCRRPVKIVNQKNFQSAILNFLFLMKIGMSSL